MFGIGPTELIVVLVIALIVVGPERLPQMAGQIGKAIRDFRQMSGDVTGEFQRAFQLDEPQDAQRTPVFSDEVINPSATPNGAANDFPALSAQVIPSEPPIAAANADEASADTDATAGEAAPVATDYSTLATPPLATREEPLAGVSMLDEPEPPPVATIEEAQPIAGTAVAANGITDAWDAVMTTEATIPYPEPTAEDLQAEAVGAAVAVAEREEAVTSEMEVAASRPRVDPAAEPTIREVIESQVAAEAFRERRRIATYRRHR